MPLDERKIIARRAALELKANSVVNLGIGMPEGVAEVAAEERVIDLLTLTAEPGVIGGIPAGGLDFGAAINAAGDASTSRTSSTSTTAAASTSRSSAWRRPTPRATSTSAASARAWPAPAASSTSARTRKQVVFVGTFTAGGLEVAVADGRLAIRREGRDGKFVAQVEHRTYSGARRGRPRAERCSTSPSAASSGWRPAGSS